MQAGTLTPIRKMAGVIAVGALLASAAVAAQGPSAPGGPRPQDPRVPPTESAPTFSKDVAPIFYKNCVSCHRPGEIAPMSLITYRDVRPWAKSIRAKVLAREMPPWHADPQHGKFRNDLSLAERDIDTIVKWANAGAREGNPAEMPALPKLPEGWQIGTPDAVFQMPVEYAMRSSRTIEKMAAS